MTLSPRRMRRHGTTALLLAVCLLAPALLASAQQMPDPSLIHGKALPGPELANGTVTVRVVRESIGNDVPGQTVTVAIAGRTETATTDAMGRAEFKGLPAGQDGRASVTVDGESMTSDTFTVPPQGGVRVILVAGIAKAAERRAAEAAREAAAPAVKGTVVFGGNSRVLMQFQDDVLQVYYVLDIVNSARSRVDLGGPLVVDLPPGTGGATVLEGSSPTATVAGNRLTVTGPFAAGTTSVQVAFRLTHTSDKLTLSQTWPAAFQSVTVGVQKIGALSVSSPQFAETRDVRTESGTTFALGSGGALAAGTPLVVNLANLPFHSRTPRYAALGLAGLMIVLGMWAATRPTTNTKSLAERREQLLQELTQLEVRRRSGAISAERFAARRTRLVAELEQIYGDLDHTAGGPAGGGEGVAA